MKIHCKSWFDKLLFDWVPNESLFSKDRNWEMLNEFFDFTYQSMIFDTLETSIEREDD